MEYKTKIVECRSLLSEPYPDITDLENTIKYMGYEGWQLIAMSSYAQETDPRRIIIYTLVFGKS